MAGSVKVPRFPNWRRTKGRDDSRPSLPFPFFPMPRFALRGLVAAPYTPFKSDGSLALDTIPAYAAFLAAQGVRGAFINGTTGEGASLTTPERKLVAEAWRRAA